MALRQVLQALWILEKVLCVFGFGFGLGEGFGKIEGFWRADGAGDEFEGCALEWGEFSNDFWPGNNSGRQRAEGDIRVSVLEVDMADVGFLEANLFPDGIDVFEAGRLEEESDMGLVDFGDQANDCGGIIGDRAVVSFQQDFGVLDFGGEMLEAVGYDSECGGIGGGNFGAGEETDFFESVERNASGEGVNFSVEGGIGSDIRIDVEVGTEDGWGET